MTPDNEGLEILANTRKTESVEAHTNKIRAILRELKIKLPESFESNPLYANASTIVDPSDPEKQLPIVIVKEKSYSENSLTLAPKGDNSHKYPETVILINEAAYDELIAVCTESVELTVETNLRNAI